MSDSSDVRIGLALSGGGFRASFFHIGILASLAERDRLGTIDVISTVSGGSVIGVLYFLRLKEEYEKRFRHGNSIEDIHLNSKDYVDIVKGIEKEFRLSVQKNLRARIFTNFFTNLRMSAQNYSRSDRMGELYDKYFYGNDNVKLGNIGFKDKNGKVIGSEYGKSYEEINSRRKDKIPQLVINATSLNTGHNWHFEITKMGEPPKYDKFQCEIDKNLRLRRPGDWNEVAEAKLRDIALGIAVAGSTCVPGLFPPLSISNMYEKYEDVNKREEEIRVQLVDGGVHDNLGIEGLLFNGCNAFYISDASGQLGDDPAPDTGTLKVLARVSSISMTRVREESLMRIKRSANTQWFYYFHLRKGIEGKEVAYKSSSGIPPRTSSSICKKSHKSSTNFGVDPEVQDMLSRIRTDLDSFSDIEANSLMCNGYLMCDKELEDVGAKGSGKLNSNVNFDFMKYKGILLKPTEYMRRCLAAGSRMVLKSLFILDRKIRYFIGFIFLISLLGGGYSLFEQNLISEAVWLDKWEMIKAYLGMLLISVMAPFLFVQIPKILRFFKFSKRVIYFFERPIKFAIVAFQAFLFLVSWINILTLHRLFNYLGSEKKVLRD